MPLLGRSPKASSETSGLLGGGPQGSPNHQHLVSREFFLVELKSRWWRTKVCFRHDPIGRPDFFVNHSTPIESLSWIWGTRTARRLSCSSGKIGILPQRRHSRRLPTPCRSRFHPSTHHCGWGRRASCLGKAARWPSHSGGVPRGRGGLPSSGTLPPGPGAQSYRGRPGTTW